MHAINKLKTEEIERLVNSAVTELDRSPRGKMVRGDLLTLLEGPISQLDEEHWMSIIKLLAAYRAGWKGTVLDALRDASGK